MTTGDEEKKIEDAGKSSLSYSKQLAEAFKINFETLGKTIEDTYKAQVELNKAFGQGQERLTETYRAVSDAAPRVARLGGDIKDVQKTMIGIAEASRRNVIANTEDVEKLFAATELIGGSAESLSNSFLDVGVGIGQIGPQLEDSINYIQSIGGNTKTVMKDVTDNMGQMNRFQFEGGVKGLTKMAAQASMLRFDMKETFQFAEKVLDPEGAVETAAAIQRLGVSMGNLADPFQLMNQSLTDPAGLQDSLIKATKQFTEYDEKTKTFKINPQGVLTLRELAKATNTSFENLSKSALAAAELDERLSSINPSLVFENEEDKQYLNNIATMKDGKYQVEVTDEKGEKVYKDLGEITQQEMNKLIEEQKTGPKTLEQMTKLQLGLDEDILANVKSINAAISQGLTSPKQITKGIAATQRVTKTVLGEASDAFKAKDFRDLSEGVLKELGNVAINLKDGNKPLTSAFENGISGLGGVLEASQKRFTEVLKEVGEKIAAGLTNNTAGERMIKGNVNKAVESYGGNVSTSSSPITPSGGNRAATLQNGQSTVTTQTTKGTVDVGGKIEVDIKAPNGVSTEQLKQILTTTFNESRFKDYIFRLMPDDKSKSPESNTY
jgi:hypothetical protein